MPKSTKRGGASNGGFHPYTHRGRNSSSSSAKLPPPPVLKSFKSIVYKFDYDPDPRTGRKWHELHDLEAPGVDALVFGANFDIKDHTLGTLSQYPTLCTRLRTFVAGDEGTGHGTSVTERAFIDFVGKCPELRLVRLDSHMDLGKDALSAILRACPKIEALRISGQNRTPGKINDQALIALAQACETDASLATSLRDLTLIDQFCDEKGIKRLQKARSQLIVRVGQSEGKYHYDGCAYDVAYKKGKMEFGPQVWEQYEL